MKYLLIGGERAGEMVDMGFPLDRIRIPAKPVLRHHSIAVEYGEPTNPVIREFQYSATRMVDCSGNCHTIYTLDGVDPILELMRVYQGGAK